MSGVSVLTLALVQEGGELMLDRKGCTWLRPGAEQEAGSSTSLWEFQLSLQIIPISRGRSLHTEMRGNVSVCVCLYKYICEQVCMHVCVPQEFLRSSAGTVYLVFCLLVCLGRSLIAY